MKKIICYIALLLALVVIYPVSTASAATKINKTKEEMMIGDTVKLKITGTKETVKWSSSDKTVATVSKKGNVTAKDGGKVTITAKVGNKKYKCKITVKYDDEKMIQETYDWLLKDVYLKTFGCVDGYANWGTNELAEPITDEEFAERLVLLEEVYKQKSRYDKYYKQLDDKKYQDVKDLWFGITDKIDEMYEIVTASEIVRNGKIDLKYRKDVKTTFLAFPVEKID